VEAFKRNLPVEALNPRTPTAFKVHLHKWKYRKEKIVAKLIEEMKESQKRMSNDYLDYDSDDSDWDMIHNDGHPGAPQVSDETKQLERFLTALPTCHLLTIGFDYSGSIKEEKCFCPCHHQQTKQWRDLTGAHIGNGECKGTPRFETPNRLVAHLRSMKDCDFHQYTLKYLEELYGDWHPSCHLKHKGLYFENSQQYREAARLEQQQRDR